MPEELVIFTRTVAGTIQTIVTITTVFGLWRPTSLPVVQKADRQKCSSVTAGLPRFSEMAGQSPGWINACDQFSRI